ncbi:MAG: acyltransferase, partial [Bacteroidaceae bacterium]|nr:acyltransferase [Bacteroidaceae bacterium]
LVLRRLSKVVLSLLTMAAAFCTLDLCLNWNIFGVLTEGRDANMYTVIGGWSITAEQMYIGFTRLAYPFLSGLLISRIGRFIQAKGGFWWCSLILLILFSIPCVGGGGHVLNGIYNAACILLMFPIVVMIGAGSQIKDAKSMRICTFLGELSYPLYITHYPLMYMQMNWAWSHPDAPMYAHIMVGVSVFLLSVGMAYACLKLYDLPVRKWLTDNWLKKK